MTAITTKAQHSAALKKVDELMKKGERHLTIEESVEIRRLGVEIQAFEKAHYYIAPPRTLEAMIELKMYELSLNQAGLAQELGVSTTKLSLILNKKQKPDVAFLKALYTKLHVDADFILSHV